MSTIYARRYKDIDVPEDNENTILTMHPASQESVDLVTKAAHGPSTDNGRSNWLWIRLTNGDLILGVYPQGDTYCAVEHDAAYNLSTATPC